MSKPIVRTAELSSGCRRSQEAKAGSRKAPGNAGTYTSLFPCYNKEIARSKGMSASQGSVHAITGNGNDCTSSRPSRSSRRAKTSALGSKDAHGCQTFHGYYPVPSNRPSFCYGHNLVQLFSSFGIRKRGNERSNQGTAIGRKIVGQPTINLLKRHTKSFLSLLLQQERLLLPRRIRTKDGTSKRPGRLLWFQRRAYAPEYNRPDRAIPKAKAC